MSLAAVRFAREHDALVAVRGGGHDVAGNGVCDGGLVIDLSLMKGIRVDPARRTARIQAGVIRRYSIRDRGLPMATVKPSARIISPSWERRPSRPSPRSFERPRRPSASWSSPI
ncbi:FAD-dependent oxidoreductase [Vitiosangium sp. GDMCC 1.1324]|uniref:FAD-binding oxidoreductase n=1 Tax=Vitiosangium sp. (strain GDMCC 1.1324) TaxID=2138576 RepID=UPI0018EE9053